MAGYVRVEDLFVDSKPTSIAEDVRRQIFEERRRTILDPDVIRHQEDWGALAGKVVGGEGEG